MIKEKLKYQTNCTLEMLLRFLFTKKQSLLGGPVVNGAIDEGVALNHLLLNVQVDMQALVQIVI